MTVEQRVVTQDEADIRLDRYLRRHIPGVTQSVVQKLCRTGQIRVDGKRVETSTRLTPGQAVRIPPVKATPAGDKPAPPLDPDMIRDALAMVLYRDEAVIVLDKPHGLPSQGGPGINRHVDRMLDALRFGFEHRPRLVHRLDRDTSGVMVVARTPGVAAKLAAGFRSRVLEKTYWAVVCGRPVPVEGRIDAPLVRIEGFRGERTAIAKEGDEDVARAVTDYRTLDHAARKLAWLELRPHTGRTHQLRVHCAGIKAPILGDAPYGEIRREDGVPRNTALVEGLSDQLHLHARRLTLPHPDGGTLTVEADLPAHMKATFRQLAFDAPPPAAALRRK
jgi:23S rRNA pseudouridine955/2504/2580 synthase